LDPGTSLDGVEDRFANPSVRAASTLWSVLPAGAGKLRPLGRLAFHFLILLLHISSNSCTNLQLSLRCISFRFSLLLPSFIQLLVLTFRLGTPLTVTEILLTLRSAMWSVDDRVSG
jgi:hypothetical protein